MKPAAVLGQLRALPASTWLLFTATLVNRSGTMALPFLVLYLTRKMGQSPSEAGMALFVYGIGALASAPLSGWLCDRVGALRVMQGSLILSGLLLLTIPLIASPSLVLVWCLAWALIGEAYRPAVATLLSVSVGGEGRRLAVAVIRLAVNLGMSIGPVVGGLLAHFSYALLFLVDGTTSILAALVLLLAPRVAREHGRPRVEGNEPSRRFALALSAPLIPFLGALVPVAMVLFQFEGPLPLYMVQDLGMSEVTFGSVFLVNTLLIVFLEVPLNLAISHWPHRRAVALGALLTGAGFGLLVFATNVAGVAGAIAVWTFGEMLLLPASAAFVGDLAPPGRVGAAMGLYHMVFALSFALGPWAGTVLYDRHGAEFVWLACLAAGLASTALVLLIGPPMTK